MTAGTLSVSRLFRSQSQVTRSLDISRAEGCCSVFLSFFLLWLLLLLVHPRHNHPIFILLLNSFLPLYKYTNVCDMTLHL